MIDDRELIIALYDLYGGLLTDKQKTYFEDYYFMDLSFFEIAENYSISKNAVYDQIRRTIGILEKFEDELGLNKKINAISNLDIDKETKEKIISILKE